jgi:hypothetical protein
MERIYSQTFVRYVLTARKRDDAKNIINTTEYCTRCYQTSRRASYEKDHCSVIFQ